MKKCEECSFSEDDGENSNQKCDKCIFIEYNGQIVCKNCGCASNEKILENNIPLTTKDNDENNNQIVRVTRPNKSLIRKRLRNQNLIQKILLKSNCEISEVVKKEVLIIYND
jgi:transcription initiation factor TFIIIB Brf1 subunit/transcription initiation factor TFIIB